MASVQIFLLAMIVVGMLVRAVSGSDDQEQGLGVRIFAYLFLLAGWILLTLVTFGVGVTIFAGAVWVWERIPHPGA